jgi:hypothetical protein
MNRTPRFLFSLAILGWVVPVCGAEPSSDYERLKPLEWQVGDWVSEYKSAADSGPIKKGDTVTVHFSLRWSPERSFMVNDSFTVVNGKRIATGTEVISWDYEKSVISHSYNGTWGKGQGVWTKVGDTAELEWAIRGQYGAFKGTSHVKRSADTWEWQIVDQTHDGEEMPDMPVATFRRKNCAPAGDLWDAYQKAAAGKWVGEGELIWDIPQYQVSKGTPFQLQLSLEKEMQGKVLTGIQDFRIEAKPGEFQARIVVGWDPSSQRIRLFAFWDDGFVEELFFSRREGSTFFGTYASKAPGMPAERYPICLDFPNPDRYAYKFRAGPHKGKVLSSWTRAKE